MRVRYLFLPGWGAPVSLYRGGLPDGWEALRPPSFRAGGGALERYIDWLLGVVEREESPVVLAGHSMGGALAVLAAVARPERVSRLVLISPAGLPLRKPLRASVATFVAQVSHGVYPGAAVCEALLDVARAPRAALALARAVHGLDLTREMETVRAAGIPTTVIGCGGDTLVTTEHCRRSARLLGGTYREVEYPDGHVWMLRGRQQLRHELLAATA